jgi:hypothetical protein
MHSRIARMASYLVLLGCAGAASPLLATDAQASHPLVCPDGRYEVEGRPLLRSGEAIVIDHGSVAIDGVCEAAPAKLRLLRDGGHALYARWRECRGARNVRLVVYVAPGCETLRGNVRTQWRRLHRRFTAVRCDDHLGCRADCASDADCAATQWCVKPAGACDGSGVCEARRDDVGCPLYYDPVCGCDGQTYGNACEAYAAHANVRHAGACEATCDVAHPCPDGQFCELPDGVCASALDAGLCTDVPLGCPDVWLPVCGCDGQTYSNDCDRRAAKVSKSHDGACGAAPCNDVCDCYANPALQLGNDCPLLCPNCGNYWSCEEGVCVDRCGWIPPMLCRDDAPLSLR